MTKHYRFPLLAVPLIVLGMVALAARADADYCGDVNGCNTCISDDGGGCCVSYGPCGCYEVHCFSGSTGSSTLLVRSVGLAAGVMSAPGGSIGSLRRAAVGASCSQRASLAADDAAPAVTAAGGAVPVAEIPVPAAMPNCSRACSPHNPLICQVTGERRGYDPETRSSGCDYP